MMRLSILLALSLGTIGCAAAPGKIYSNEGRITASQPDTSAILKSAKNSNGNDSSRWVLTGTTISFNGQITNGECDRFKSQVKSDTKILKVNSAGGDAFEGLCIGREMIARNFERTVVSGICVSSCANYLFLGSKIHQIEFGIVGYHGNITALLKRDPRNENLRRQLEENKVDPKEIERIASDFVIQQQRNSVTEQSFYRGIGVSQELFERTQEPDKGAGDGKDYTFLLPTVQTFTRYGIINLQGQQEFELGQAMGMNNLLQ